MDEQKRKALEAQGWAFGDAEDFLELTPDERAEVERRMHRRRVKESARRMLEIHRETLDRLAEDD